MYRQLISSRPTGALGSHILLLFIVRVPRIQEHISYNTIVELSIVSFYHGYKYSTYVYNHGSLMGAPREQLANRHHGPGEIYQGDVIRVKPRYQ